MKLRILWPGRTKNRELRELQEFYLKRICELQPCELIETKEARGIEERYEERIKRIEAQSLEKHFKDDYIICLFHEGREMNSLDFARFLEKCTSTSTRPIAFVVGGFLGLKDTILRRADFLLSLSKMTFSHELSRIILLEQIYRSLMIIKGRHYPK